MLEEEPKSQAPDQEQSEKSWRRIISKLQKTGFFDFIGLPPEEVEKLLSERAKPNKDLKDETI